MGMVYLSDFKSIAHKSFLGHSDVRGTWSHGFAFCKTKSILTAKSKRENDLLQNQKSR